MDWTSLVYGNIIRCVDYWRRSAHISYTDTPTTQVIAHLSWGEKCSKNL